MRQNKFDLNILKQRQEKISQQIEGSALLLMSHPEYIKNYDAHHPYRADSSMVYMTGFEEPGAVFLLIPGSNPQTVMFVLPKNIEQETWTGFRFGPDLTEKHFGIDKCFNIEDFFKEAPALLKGVDSIYTNYFNDRDQDEMLRKLVKEIYKLSHRSGRNHVGLKNSYELVGESRFIKTPDEIALMKKAADASCYAHKEVMKFIKPGINERALHGVFIKSIFEKGCNREAYEGIFASGASATTLHYIFNDQECKDGEVFLIDAGGEYNFYAADITRSYPVNGKFNEDQKRVYQKVLDVQKKLINMVKPGATRTEVHNASVDMLVDVMIDEGLLIGDKNKIIENGEFKKYYPHGVGHPLGLDVHDTGKSVIAGAARRYEEGMVWTIEPGLYIPHDDSSAPKALRGLGIRIEDDIVVTKGEPLNLTAAAPKEIDEMEALIGSGY